MSREETRIFCCQSCIYTHSWKIVARTKCFEKLAFVSCCCTALILLASLPVSLSLTVHPARDDRRSPCHLTWISHSKLALQLLQGSTIWSCPDWLQTKHQWETHNLKPLKREAYNTNIFHKEGLRWTQTFQCLSLMFCHHAFPFCISLVQTLELVCMFFFLILVLPLSLVANVSPEPARGNFEMLHCFHLQHIIRLNCCCHVDTYSSGGIV